MAKKSEGHKKAISDSMKGMSGNFKGKTHTTESRRQISLSKSSYGMTFEKADKIRQEAARGVSRKKIANKYEVTYGIVRDIILENSWVSATPPIARATKPGVDF